MEADEYDKSFLKLNPDVIIITSIDADHLDIYHDEDEIKNTFKSFVQNLKPKGMLLVNKAIDLDFAVADDSLKLSYSSSLKADNYATNLRLENASQVFDAQFVDVLPGQVYEYQLKDILLKLPGKHNVENALAAIVVASYLGANSSDIKSAIESFRGVKRRYEFHANGKYVYIDDYAHHPEEVKATLEATKQLFPDKKITAVFQPHLFSRTRDFADEFGESLSLADEVLLLEIYPARELPIEGVNSKMLLEKISKSDKHIITKELLVEELTHPKREVLLTMGAGDIDRFIEPLTQCYQNEVD